MITIKTASAALAALLVSGGIAAAASATNDVNLRAGPGPEHQVVGVIPAGAPVDVMGCRGSWCQVNYAGRVGFASGSYLTGAMQGARVAPSYGATYGYAGGNGGPYGPSGYGSPVYSGGPVYKGYVYGGRGDDSYAYDDDDDDDDGYAAAPSYQPSYQWGAGRQDW